MHRDGWRGLARLLHLETRGVASWVCDAEEGNMLKESGAAKRGRGMRMLSVKVSMRCRDSCMQRICCARRVLAQLLTNETIEMTIPDAVHATVATVGNVNSCLPGASCASGYRLQA